MQSKCIGPVLNDRYVSAGCQNVTSYHYGLTNFCGEIIWLPKNINDVFEEMLKLTKPK